MATPFSQTVGTALPPTVITPMGPLPGSVVEQLRPKTQRSIQSSFSPVIIPPRTKVNLPPPETKLQPQELVGTLSFDTNGVLLTDPASAWTLAQQNPDWPTFQKVLPYVAR